LVQAYFFSFRTNTKLAVSLTVLRMVIAL